MKYIKKYKSETEFDIFFQNLYETKWVVNGLGSPKVQAWLAEGNEFEVVAFVPIPLAEYKTQQIESCNQLSFQIRNVFLPDYKLINAGIDVYEDDNPGTKLKYKKTVQAFRTEFYRISGLINSATTNNEIDIIVSGANFPTGIL